MMTVVTVVAEPGQGRRLVLEPVEDDAEAHRLAGSRRAEGMLAIARPSSGVQLERWMHDTRPVTFGERLGVCFAWSEHDRPDVARMIELGPGGWGGRHPSTRLIIEQLIARIRGGERVLDVGCGSGVLGLCALALDAAHVVAVDIKPEAIDATRTNAALNGMAERVDATAAPLAQVDGDFDLVVANVGRAALVELAPSLIARVAPHAWLAVSGFSPSQSSLVAGFLDPLVEIERTTADEWSALVLAHQSG